MRVAKHSVSLEVKEKKKLKKKNGGFTIYPRN